MCNRPGIKGPGDYAILGDVFVKPGQLGGSACGTVYANSGGDVRLPKPMWSRSPIVEYPERFRSFSMYIPR